MHHANMPFQSVRQLTKHGNSLAPAFLSPVYSTLLLLHLHHTTCIDAALCLLVNDFGPHLCCRLVSVGSPHPGTCAMRLVHCDKAGVYRLTEDFASDDRLPPYAILSHRWLPDIDEPTFEDLTCGTGLQKLGYNKIRFCGEQSRQDGIQYFWVDTCCINKKNLHEYSHAINSMFYWYRNATKCYVYLPDVHAACTSNGEKTPDWESAFRRSEWFTRGWTLQELLAPRSVEFFSQERTWLGNKQSLEQLIHEITGIAKPALQGALLSHFSVAERFSWIDHRQTTVKEDKAYCLLGIFGVRMHLRPGEGLASAFKRLEKEVDKVTKCMQDLRLTDPRHDKKRIEDTKGGLLDDSYRWILQNQRFQEWCTIQEGLLWIKGDPGKGKTMLLCGIINELTNAMPKTALLSYFFCQNGDPRLNNATAILRGLVYMLVDQQPSLIQYVRKEYDQAGRTLFEDANAWVALSDILRSILSDPNLNSTFLIIDGLDECVADLPKLLHFITQISGAPRIKWIISSRNWPDIEEQLANTGQNLSLELNAESVSTAVARFIQHKVQELVRQKKYNDKTRDSVLEHLSSNADGTFLWVALVCQRLEKIPRWDTLRRLSEFPPGLDSLYERMMEQIRMSVHVDLCKQILAVATILYRPITLEELTGLVEALEEVQDDPESLFHIVSVCGSFLTVRARIIYFVHQSANDFLLEKAFPQIFPRGIDEVHRTIFSRSLKVMIRTLRRDMYCLGHPGFPIEQVRIPAKDPLAAARYSCVYWIEHLEQSSKAVDSGDDIQDGGKVDTFLRQKYLYWLESLGLLKSTSEGVLSMSKLQCLLQVSLQVTLQDTF